MTNQGRIALAQQHVHDLATAEQQQGQALALPQTVVARLPVAKRVHCRQTHPAATSICLPALGPGLSSNYGSHARFTSGPMCCHAVRSGVSLSINQSDNPLNPLHSSTCSSECKKELIDQNALCPTALD